MLRELSVQNLALIEDIRVELRPGYCAWTGETGAGKSLLLTALSLILGGKASAQLVRAGKSEALASAVFDLNTPALRADVERILGGPTEAGRLIVTRRVGATGRTSAQANGQPVSAATLRDLGDLLIDLHGQHETRLLLDPDRQRGWLDAYGGHAPLLASYQEARRTYEQLRNRRRVLVESVERRQRERTLLQFESEELQALDPRTGEVAELTQEAHRLANLEELRSATAEAYRLLYEADRSAQGLIDKVARRLSGQGANVPDFQTAAADLARIACETREIAYSLRGLGQSFEDDPGRLDAIEARLAHYRRLASRLRTTPDGLAARHAEVAASLESIDKDEADLATFDEPLAKAWDLLKQATANLTAVRVKTSKRFARAVQMRLKDLSLGDARLTLVIETEALADAFGSAPPGEAGADRVELLFAPNAGESPQPLRKIASGGELSRVTLAIKAVLARTDRTPTLLFDEIDTGVGGRLGGVLGKMLADLSKHHQVICVTHLPQMASYAAHQWVIRKQTGRGRTRTTISLLDERERIEELAAMLRGDSAAEGTKNEAHAMLLEARGETRLTPGRRHART